MKIFIRDIPAYSDPIYRPPPKPAEIPLQEPPKKLRKLSLSRWCYIRDISETWQIIFSGATRIR